MDAQGWPLLIEVEGSEVINTALVFSPDGEYILRNGDGEVLVWRVKDGERIARMEARGTILCLATSSDGNWIAAGTRGHGVYVWDAHTFEQAFMLQNGDFTNSIDFSPDSTRLVTAFDDWTVIIWDTITRRRVLDLPELESNVCTVKYSPRGDRIAIAASQFVRVYDSNDGRLLVDIPMAVLSVYDNSFVWSKDRLFIMAHDKIVQIEASTGSPVSEWLVPGASSGLAIAIPRHGEFFAYSARTTVMFWDAQMHSQLAVLEQARNIGSMAFSPDNSLLAISEESGTKVTIRDISRGIVPFMNIPEDVHSAWKQNRLADVEEMLTKIITRTNVPSHHVYANRALIRARLGRRAEAVKDAEESINAQRSVIGYIAKSVALIGDDGKKEEINCVFDMAFRKIQLHDADPLLLIKAVILFMAGEHDSAILRMNNLISASPAHSIYYVIQVYMYLLCGVTQMNNGDHDGALQSYERAQTQMRSCTGSFLHMIEFISGWKFDYLRITIQQRLCEALYDVGRMKEAGESLVEIINLFGEEIYVHGSISRWVSDFVQKYLSATHDEWVLDFKLQCAEKMVHFGDIAANTTDAVSHYSAALSLELAAPQDILVKRSKARAELGLWNLALDDANELIVRNPSSPWGYERKYVALGVGGHHKEMSNAFDTMLSKMAQSDDPEIRARGQRYPETQQTIRRVIKEAIRESPRLLINTTSGRLCDRSEQEFSFELSPIYAELVSTMTTQMDQGIIEKEIRAYYRYATLSHRCQTSEPLFEDVVSASVYELAESLTNEKLQKFCKIVRDSGINWAWSSTCCIDTTDNSVLQEALTSMFRWYEQSSLTIIYLVDICSPSQDGTLVESVWGSRAWLFQEYHASRVVRFYNNDWTIYKNIDVPNHKVSPEIVSDIEMATGISEEDLIALRPGLGNIRVKLRLASTQETTLAEDAAYSLFGIFSVSLPVVYGEGDKALGHLLSHLLAKSGDTSILAWTGASGKFNSCLPSNIDVFGEPSVSHVQPDMEKVDLDAVAAGLRASSLNISLLMKLIERLNELPTPLFLGHEMRLPCIAIRLEPPSATSTGAEQVYHSKTTSFGDVKIRTKEDLTRFHSLYLVHPWIDFLLDRPPAGSERRSRDEDSDDETPVHEVLAFPTRSIVPLSTIVQTHATRFVTRLKRFSHRDWSIPPPPQGNKQMKAVQFAARLKQPFEALLFATDGNANGGTYKRIAASSRIPVQVENITPFVLKHLVDNVRVLDVL